MREDKEMTGPMEKPFQPHASAALMPILPEKLNRRDYDGMKQRISHLEALVEELQERRSTMEHCVSPQIGPCTGPQ